MKKTLLILGTIFGLSMNAQTTHHVMWGLGENSAQFSKTISLGDTVEWMWTTAHNHNVTTNNGSAETFASPTSNVIGFTYSHTFNVLGTNSYKCTIHASMAGTITVNNVMGTEKVSKDIFRAYPNPANDVFTIEADAIIEHLSVYDINGRVILDSKGGTPVSKIYTSNYMAGSYLVKVKVGGVVKTLTMIKS
jgi:plastocyanin